MPPSGLRGSHCGTAAFEGWLYPRSDRSETPIIQSGIIAARFNCRKLKTALEHPSYQIDTDRRARGASDVGVGIHLVGLGSRWGLSCALVYVT